MSAMDNPFKMSQLAALAAVLTALLLTGAVLVLAAPGDPDPTFGSSGIVTTNVLNDGDDAVLGVAIQPDGKILAGGFTTDGTANRLFALARYNLDGSLDTGFGGNGTGTLWTTLDVNNNTSAREILEQPDGKIVLVGGGGLFHTARYLPNGDLDSAFDGDGRASATFSGYAEAFAGVLQGDRILAVGATGIGASEDLALARFTTSGAPDSTFNGDGTLTLDLAGADQRASAVVIMPNDKILIAGQTYTGSNFDFLLARFEISGTLDTSFGVGGVVTTALGVGDNMLTSLVLQPDGKILTGGEANNGSNRDFALARYNSDGSLDTSFGAGGLVISDLGGFDDRSFGLAQQPDGKIVLVGASSNGTDLDVAVARYLPNGSLDSGFGNGGIVLTPVGSGDDWGRAVSIQPDLKLVVAGWTDSGVTNEFLLLRLGANGAPVAVAGPPQEVVGGELVHLDGGGSFDPDGHTPLGYGWMQSGGTPVTLSATDLVSTTFIAPPAPGVLTFTLAVTDSLGLRSTPDLVTVAVTVEMSELFTYLPIVLKEP